MTNGRILLAALGLALGSTAVLSAQPQRMPISRTLTATLKPDRVADFMSALKDYNAAYGKIPGVGPRLQYQSLTGPNRYRLVLTYPDWAAMDAPAASANNADIARNLVRINSCIESTTVLITELLPELSTGTNSEPPTLVRISRVRIRPDRVQEWMGIVKNELLPAYKKAGRTLTVRQVRMGAPTNEFHMSTRVANWAEAGKNQILDSMGKEAYDRMVAKITAVTLTREIDMFRYRPDLSWSPPR
jgi:hypothetical protein